MSLLRKTQNKSTSCGESGRRPKQNFSKADNVRISPSENAKGKLKLKNPSPLLLPLLLPLQKTYKNLVGENRGVVFRQIT